MKPNKEQIEKLAYTNPTVYAVWNQIEWGNLTYEEGLILMVTTLAQQNQAQLDTMIKHHERCVNQDVFTYKKS